ncbi:MAG: tRNA pseudouridine(38-40) synthase TruA [Clostridia bacterium]|nr:tRNA pseudouridine(38-40) synthase TruA [Clostridia bacterium]
MRNILLTLKYDGTNYHGWQIQENAVTVQQVLADAIEKITKQKIMPTGCSRTDSGVHANMFCCNFKSDITLPDKEIIKALNGNLPFDVVVTDCMTVNDDFHARYDCKSKEYIYRIVASPVRNPFLENYAIHYKYPLNIDDMNYAAKQLIGTHDFSAFCSVGSNVQSTERQIFNAEFSKKDDLVTFSIEGDGFLYNMVRIIVGTMLYVSQGKIKKEDIHNIILSKNRENAGPTAPAKALFLNKVNY